ncbi:phage minor structural protein, N-domain protein [Schleiferilactobacillus harbinensis DSM 16991]|uniref:Phage minor structural protein, N-domain protein n=3 Tax=Schleiferilactobacillus harbinensis TaxID=304207 RepID=A0A0R1X705_9LACO|nr:phage minor structural protein, N-domain protein [Schleiferilactobacillus harbinensis DSM 16991]
MGYVEHVISCQVESVYDQFPQMTLICEYTQFNADRLLKDRTLMADVGDGWNKQMFRINSVESDWSDNQREMTIIATHVASDLSGNVLTADVSTANASPSQVWSMVASNLAEPTDVTVNSSITDVAIVNWNATQIDQLSSILFGRDAKSPTFTSLYDAEWWFDNYQWTFEHHVGRDTGIVIKYGQHLKSLQNQDTIAGVYTAVRPISKYTPGQTAGTGDDSNVIALDGTALIQYAGTGGLPVYDTPFKGQIATGKTLTNGSRFKIFSYAKNGTVNDHTWYNLGGKQWVDGNYLSFDKGQTGQFPSTVGNKATGKGTIAAGLADKPGVISKYDGVITVNYVGPGKVAIWNSPWVSRHVTGSYMANGSAWNAYGKATDESGQTWYNLGGNQWVSAQYVALDKAKDYAYQKVRGIGTAKVDKGKIALWNRPSFNGSIVRMISSGTRWQIYGEASGENNNTWYDLGRSQWIDGQYMDFSAANAVEPKPVGGDSSSSDTSSDTSDTVWSYNSPGVWNTRVKQYTTGNQVTIYGQGSGGGATWYNIGHNEWIQADYLTFGNNTDVDPSGSADDMTAEATEVTVTLPEKYIAVPMPNGQQYEHQRIVNFDASQYGITTVDDLRSITQAYIRDNNIGKPQITLTIDYDELQGHYSNLASVRLYDTVTVFLPEIGLNIKAEVTNVIYDTLLQQNTQVTIGNRPLTTTDDLAAWVKKAEDKASTAAQKNSKAMDDMDLAWKRAIDTTNAAFKAGDAKTAEQQTEWENQFKETIDQDINSFKDYVGGQVQSANELASIVHYNNNDVTFYNGSGTQVGSLGAGGLVYTDPSTGKTTSVVDANGNIGANYIVGNSITGTVIHGAEIDGGTIDGVDFIRSKSGGSYAVMSYANGFSISNGSGTSALGPTSLTIQGESLQLIDVKNLHYLLQKNGMDHG